MSILEDCLNRVSTLLRPEYTANDSIDTWSGIVMKDTPITDCPFVVFDTELSGLDHRRDFIVSIGALKMTGGKIHAGKDFYRLVNPEGEMSGKSIKIHGLTPEDLRDAETIDAILPEFLEFITDSVLVGHFVRIDLSFVNECMKRMFRTTVKNPAVDTHTIHEWFYENAADFKQHFNGSSIKTDLFSVAERYRIPVTAAHNALSDAFITAQLFQRFICFFESQGLRTLGDLLDIGRA